MDAMCNASTWELLADIATVASPITIVVAIFALILQLKQLRLAASAASKRIALDAELAVVADLSSSLNKFRIRLDAISTALFRYVDFAPTAAELEIIRSAEWQATFVEAKIAAVQLMRCFFDLQRFTFRLTVFAYQGIHRSGTTDRREEIERYENYIRGKLGKIAPSTNEEMPPRYVEIELNGATITERLQDMGDIVEWTQHILDVSREAIYIRAMPT